MDNADPHEDRLVAYGLAAQSGESAAMGRAHRHNDIELNFVESGAVRYLFGGTYVTVDAGRLALFWATVPHQVIAVDAGTRYIWVTLPLTAFLHWRLAEPLTRTVLHGVAIDPQPAAAGSDGTLLRQWHADLQEGTAENRAIVLLEIEARLRRLALTCRVQGTAAHRADAPGGHGAAELGTAAALAQVIADRCAGPLRVADIADAVGVHPNYAMTLFRRTFGLSIVAYLTQYRVANAQRLLATTDAPVLDIALEAGFGSASRFYTAFRRICDQSPGAYRAGNRVPGHPPAPPGR